MGSCHHFSANSPVSIDASAGPAASPAAGEMIVTDGGRIENIDITIFCESPKVGPQRENMRARDADILGLAIDRVNVKGKTTEQLGFLGRGEGIAAQAAASVSYPAAI